MRYSKYTSTTFHSPLVGICYHLATSNCANTSKLDVGETFRLGVPFDSLHAMFSFRNYWSKEHSLFLICSVVFNLAYLFVI